MSDLPNVQIGGTYTCAACGKTFTSDWSHEEAAAEYEALVDKGFYDPSEETDIWCDDCFQRLSHS